MQQLNSTKTTITPTFSQYFPQHQLFKFLPPASQADNFIELIDECNNEGIDNCKNYFSTTYSKNALQHSLPTNKDIKQQVSHLCSPVYSKKQTLDEQLQPYSVLCQEIPLSDMFEAFNTLNQTQNFHLLVMQNYLFLTLLSYFQLLKINKLINIQSDPVSRRQVYNNLKKELNETDTVEHVLRQQKFKESELKQILGQYDKFLSTFELNYHEKYSGELIDLRMNGVTQDFEVDGKTKQFHLQLILISFRDNKESKMKYYNLYNIVSWVDTDYLSEDIDEIKQNAAKFVVASYLVCAFVLFFILGISFIKAIQIQQDTEKPIVELTSILQNFNTDIFNETKKTHSAQYNLQLELEMDMISDSFTTCFELKVLFEKFRQLFQTIQYANEAYFQGDSASSLMQWAQAYVFFQNIKNKRAQGISLNNLGNTHLIEYRFDEALECSKQSINLADQELIDFLQDKSKDNNSIASAEAEVNQINDCYMIKLHRIIQYCLGFRMKLRDIDEKLQGKSKKQKDIIQNEYKVKLDEQIVQLNIYEKNMNEIIGILESDLKRDCICYITFASILMILEKHEDADIYLQKISNMLQILSAQKDSEIMFSPTKRTNNAFQYQEINSGNLNSYIIQPDSYTDAAKYRTTTQTQLSFIQFDDLNSQTQTPFPKYFQGNNANNNYNTINQISLTSPEKKGNFLNRLIRTSEITSYKKVNLIKTPSKLSIPEIIPYPSLLQQRMNKGLLNKNSSTVSKSHNQDQENEINNNQENVIEDENCNINIEEREQSKINFYPCPQSMIQIKNPFSMHEKLEIIQDNIAISENDQVILSNLTSKLPQLPSIHKFMKEIDEKQCQKIFLNIPCAESQNNNLTVSLTDYNDDDDDDNIQNNKNNKHSINFSLNNKTSPQNIEQSNYLTNDSFHPLKNQMNEDSYDQVKTTQNHILYNTNHPLEPTLSAIKDITEISLDTQTPDHKNNNSFAHSKNNRRNATLYIQTYKRSSDDGKLSNQIDSPLTQVRSKRHLSQNQQPSRLKNMSIFNRSTKNGTNSSSSQSVFLSIPLDIIHQRYILLRVKQQLINKNNNNFNQNLKEEQLDQLTSTFENYQRYFLIDRKESLNLLQKIYPELNQNKQFQESINKFNEVSWHLNIIIHEQISDQKYDKVERCIEYTCELINKLSPNKHQNNKCIVFLNNQIQSELLSFSTHNFPFFSSLDSLIKNSFSPQNIPSNQSLLKKNHSKEQDQDLSIVHTQQHNDISKNSNNNSPIALINEQIHFNDTLIHQTERQTDQNENNQCHQNNLQTPMNNDGSQIQNDNELKEILQKKSQFIKDAMIILREYSEECVNMKRQKQQLINNPYQLQFHQLVLQLNQPSFVNLFLIFWKAIIKYHGQHLYDLTTQINKNHINQNHSQNKNNQENIILSIHDSGDEKTIYESIFILNRMRNLLQELKIKVIIRILIKAQSVSDLQIHYQTVKQITKYVQLIQLQEYVTICDTTNKIHHFFLSNREPIIYLGLPMFVEKI